MAPILTPAPWEARGDVGDVVEIRIVQDHELRVARRDDVLLEIIGAEPERERLGFERVLGKIPARAAVRDYDRRSGHRATRADPLGRRVARVRA